MREIAARKRKTSRRKDTIQQLAALRLTTNLMKRVPSLYHPETSSGGSHSPHTDSGNDHPQACVAVGLSEIG